MTFFPAPREVLKASSISLNWAFSFLTRAFNIMSVRMGIKAHPAAMPAPPDSSTFSIYVTAVGVPYSSFASPP